MIAYIDSSVLARFHLPDEVGHQEALRLLADREIAAITGTWTRVEVAAALARAALDGRGDREALLEALAKDLEPEKGIVTVMSAPQAVLELGALELVVEYRLRAADAWHLACAGYLLPAVSESGEPTAFATRDDRQRDVALRLGFAAV